MIYDYVCENCNHEFTKEQRITENPIKECPKCKSKSVKRLISGCTFVLKGGGWSDTGYSSSGSKKRG